MPQKTKPDFTPLASFDVTSAGDEYAIRVEDESGQTLEMTATYEQLEIIADVLENVLDEDEEAGTEVDDEDTAQE